MVEENQYSEFYRNISGQRGNVVTDLEEYVKDRNVTKFIIIDEPEKIRVLKEI